MLDESLNQELSEYFEADPEMEAVDEKELLKKLEEKSFLEMVRTSNEWRVLREAFRRIYYNADKALTHCDPKDYIKIVQYQTAKQFYEDLLPTTIVKILHEGKEAVKHMRRKRKLKKVPIHLKKDA
jgi:hypothetical protein